MTQQVLTQEGGSFTGNIRDAINANFTSLYGSQVVVGNVFFLNPASGNDTNAGDAPGSAFQSLASAYAACLSGNNDVVVLVGDGATTNTARLSAAFTWSKNATHLIGLCSPVLYSQRARIAPTSGATAFTPFMTISGNGCIFQNIAWFHGFTTGTTSQINLVLTGSRNVFKNCHIAGMGDQESADSAGSRSVKIGSSGSGENVFEDCVIGLDTVTRGAANASVEFTAATTRNVFRRCIFPFMCDAATPLGFIGTGSGNMDRHQVFDQCLFINAVQSTSTTMSGLGTLAASSGGLLLFTYSTLVGITEYGTDATTRGQCYVDGGTVTAATTGIAVNPT
jgi:hypothetical protein